MHKLSTHCAILPSVLWCHNIICIFFTTNVIHVCFAEFLDDFFENSYRKLSVSIGKQKFRKRTLMKLSFPELENATHHFTTRIGQGGSAIIYKVCPYAFLCLLSFRVSLLKWWCSHLMLSIFCKCTSCSGVDHRIQHIQIMTTYAGACTN